MKRSGLEPKLLQSVHRNSCTAYWRQIRWPSVTYKLRGQGHFSVLMSEVVTQEQITVGSSNLAEGLIMW